MRYMANFINDCAGNNLVHASISENCHACFNTCQKIGFNLENQTKIRGLTLQHSACEAGNLEIAKILLNLNLNINAKNFSAETPLHLIATKGCLELAKLLIEKMQM